MEPKTFVALTDEQLVLLAWAMEAYFSTLTPNFPLDEPFLRVLALRDKMNAHAKPAWDRMTEAYE